MNMVTGAVLNLIFKLEQHRILDVSLRRWIGVLLLLMPLLALLKWLSWWYAAPCTLILALIQVGCLWAARRGYVVIEWGRWSGEKTAQAALRADEQVPVWASGVFAVGGKTCMVLHQPARYSFLRTREHVIMAQIRRTRFLLLAASSSALVGWWYVFFQPGLVQCVQTGYIVQGVHKRPGLALTFYPEEQPNRAETIYLAFADEVTGWRVLDDLAVDIPQTAHQKAD